MTSRSRRCQGSRSIPSTAPHFVRSRWPLLRSGHGPRLMVDPADPYPAVAAVSAHFARRGKARLDHLRPAEVGTSDQRNHARGRDGRCGSPSYPLLVRARLAVDRSDDRTSLRRSKVFPSLAGSRLATAPCCGRHSLDPVTRGSTGVSVHRDFRSAPQPGSYGALIAPSTEMSSITIYRADRVSVDRSPGRNDVVHARRQLFANAVIAASRVAA